MSVYTEANEVHVRNIVWRIYGPNGLVGQKNSEQEARDDVAFLNGFLRTDTFRVIGGAA